MSSDGILEILDRCCDAFTFPMLDNGYVYLAATRLSLFRSPEDWAMVIEVFGYSPREGIPSTHVYTFASRLHARDDKDDYADEEAYQNYLAQNPHNESRFANPIEEDDWLDEDDAEMVSPSAKEVVVRGRAIALPQADDYAAHDIELEDPPNIQVFELCRYLAAVARDDVLATPAERRASVPPELTQVLELEEWHHPNVVDDADRPSGSDTFRQLAEVLVSGDVSRYQPREPNTHGVNWPDGGSL